MARLPPGATRIATYNPVGFARVVAKIAYSHAFAEAHSKGESTALNTPIPKLILGDMAEAGKWMGGYHDEAPDTHLHQLRVRTLKSDATGEEFRISIVRLFSLFGMPSYIAVVKTGG